jgi:hypothetical protein
MNEIKIDYNIELPPKRGRNQQKYPWHKIKIGGSFFVSGAKRVSIYNSAMNWSKKNLEDALWVTRTRREKGKKGVRIWRLK